MKLQSPAKINVHLKVMEKTSSGFHRLQTLMIKVALYDDLHVKIDSDARAQINIHVPGHVEISGEQNIMHQAAQAFMKASKINFGLEVELHKSIPMGAGLGGGSSNAACLLRCLNAYWKSPLSDQDLFELGCTLGSDVGFFMQTNDWAVCRGFGNEIVSQGSADALPLVICFPGHPLSTAKMYKSLSRGLTWDHHDDINAASFHAQAWEDFQTVLPFENDFESVLEGSWFKSIKQAFNLSGCFYTGLSGSGSAVFGLYQTQQQAMDAARVVKPFGEVFLTHT